MIIEEIMTTRVATVSLQDTVRTISQLLAQAPFHHLIVLDDEGRPAGIISDRDILRVTSPFLETPSENRRDVSTLNKVAHQIMSRKLISIKKETKVREAIDILLQNKISCLPVLDGLKNLEGLVTWRDLIKAAIKLETQKGWGN